MLSVDRPLLLVVDPDLDFGRKDCDRVDFFLEDLEEENGERGLLLLPSTLLFLVLPLSLSPPLPFPNLA